MHHDVVGMPISPMPVVARDHIGIDVVEYLGEQLGRLVEIGADESSRCPILFPAGHAAVVESEPSDLGHAEHVGRELGFPSSTIDQRFTGCQIVGGLPMASVGGYDQDDPVTLVGRTSDAATCGDRLVVRMGVEANECAHASTTAPDVRRASMRAASKPHSERISRVC
jgi:hypothetical protein